MEPWLNDPRVRRDLKKVTVGMNKRYTIEAAEKLQLVGPAGSARLGAGDKVFPLKWAERLASEVPNARIVQIPDAATFVPFDQPQRLADEIAAFVAAGCSRRKTER